MLVRYGRKGGEIVAFDVSGHAGFADAGRDIVCAAVSALVLSTVHGLRYHCRQQINVADDLATYSVRLAGPVTMDSQTLLKTMLSGLKAIARSYPGYMKVQSGRTPVTGPRGRLSKSLLSRTQ